MIDFIVKYKIEL